MKYSRSVKGVLVALVVITTLLAVVISLSSLSSRPEVAGFPEFVAPPRDDQAMSTEPMPVYTYARIPTSMEMNWSIPPPPSWAFFLHSTHPRRKSFYRVEPLSGTVLKPKDASSSLTPTPAFLHNSLYHFSNRLENSSTSGQFFPCDAYVGGSANPLFRYPLGPLHLMEHAAVITEYIASANGSSYLAWPEAAVRTQRSLSQTSTVDWGLVHRELVRCRVLEGWLTAFVSPHKDAGLVNTVGFKDPPSAILDPFAKQPPPVVVAALASYMCLTAVTAPATEGGGGGVVIDPTSGLFWGPPSKPTRTNNKPFESWVPVCLTSSAKYEATMVSSALLDADAQWHLSSPAMPTAAPTAAPTAYFGYIERPQHTLQFLFSLVGHLAALYDLSSHTIDESKVNRVWADRIPTEIDIYFSIVTYGKFQKQSDATDFVRYPHMELLALAPYLVERMKRQTRGIVTEAGGPNDGLSWERWRRALFSQIRFVHDKHTFKSVTTLPPPAGLQESSIRWGQVLLWPNTSGDGVRTPLVSYESVTKGKREGFRYSTLYVGGPGVRMLNPKRYRQNDARAAGGHHGTIPFVGPFYLYMIRSLLIDYYRLRTRSLPQDFLGAGGVRQYRVLVVARRKAQRRLILNEQEVAVAIAKGLVDDESVAHELGRSYASFQANPAPFAVPAVGGVWRLHESPSLVVTLVDWEELQHPRGSPSKTHTGAPITNTTLPSTIPRMLEIAMSTDVMVGMHGNGLCWACFMSSATSESMNPFTTSGAKDAEAHFSDDDNHHKHKYPLMVEVTSDIGNRNEVKEGVNVKNVGNLAGTVCPVTSLSIAGSAVENSFSKAASEGHKWKEVDVVLSPPSLRKITSFVQGYRPN